MPTGENTLRNLPPHVPQTVSGSSLKRWTTSLWSPHSVQAYWYVGTCPPRFPLALAALNC
jgi:hypothetical protein